ncbi:hypothetical protein AAFF_G00105350 [Aldrovandia affinis]|uniref:Uncharacterized protein n=1 Tax=Aldrovandia affinis TaxID=143900 RepID=A0AAD7T2S5_9TELE|nr:hypothetical protein AAFF_G00105350 [Aldrovandia affinis]
MRTDPAYCLKPEGPWWHKPWGKNKQRLPVIPTVSCWREGGGGGGDGAVIKKKGGKRMANPYPPSTPPPIPHPWESLVPSVPPEKPEKARHFHLVPTGTKNLPVAGAPAPASCQRELYNSMCVLRKPS